MKRKLTGYSLSLLCALALPAHASMLMGYALGQASCNNKPAIMNSVPNDGFIRIKSNYTTQDGLIYYLCPDIPGYDVFALRAHKICQYTKSSGIGLAKHQTAITVQEYLQSKTQRPVQLVNVIEDAPFLLFYYQFTTEGSHHE